ncbi:MAG: biotin--[acetyl-CoA-carboxylase] ligase [Clostridia bacterium]|nr:biotin--[acetyl-CoA-carboxylase] ligase [Clostridia bacterium]
MYSKFEILKNLTDKNIGVEILDETSSTNDYIKKYSSFANYVVLAKRQTAGRGRLNRSFHSPINSGVYMSVLVKPNLEIKDSVKITTFTAVQVAKAIEKQINMPVQIKWVNDIFINGKKICGILAESSYNIKDNKLNYAVIGIGINVFKNKFPEELKNIATSIENETGKKIDCNLLVSDIINGLININTEIVGNYLTVYKNRLFILGKTVTVDTGSEKYLAKVIDVLNSGALLIEKNGKSIPLNFGDVSIKI